MGLYDDILEEQPVNTVPQQTMNVNKKSGLYDDLLVEEPIENTPTFSENHPFLASTPEALKQFGVRTVKSFPEFAKGVNDLTALVGDKTGLQGVSNFGRTNADFWQGLSDKIQIDPKYQGIKGLSSKETFLPTVLGSVGDQATNLLMAGGGAGAGAKLATTLGLKGAAQAGLITAGTSIPNLAQEGQYLDKIQAFQQLNGRMPTIDELKQIQNVAIGEKAINTALETVSDKLLFGKLFPQGAITKNVKGIIKGAGEQALTEAATEGMQEGVSIGAENLLGINQGNNLERLADSMAIGGITGGVMGGVTSAASRPYNSQFTENTNAVNPIEAVQNVSAKILDGGRVLYDSTTDKLNAAAKAIGDMNAPDTFDTMRTLSKNGSLSRGKLEQIAPKTAAKMNAKNNINNSSDVAIIDTGIPNMLENSNLYNLSENEESNIVNEQEVQNISKEIEQPVPTEENTAVLERPETTKQSRKQKAKIEAIEKIRKIAPNSMAKIELETNQNSNKSFEQVKNEVGIGGIIKDDSDNVYEVLENGSIKNVDTNEISDGDPETTYKKYEYNPDELIKVEPFKYDAKAKGDTNRDNYVFSKQDVVDSYNNYIKNPTETNRETYQDTVGKYQDEYTQKEESFKKNDKLTQIAPKTVAKIQEANNNHIEQPSDMVKSAENIKEKSEAINKNDEVQKIAKEYADMLGHNEVGDFHKSFAKALINKDGVSVKRLVAQGRGLNDNSKKMFTKYTGIKLPTTIKGKIEVIDRWEKGEIPKEEPKTFNNNNQTITFKEKDLKDKYGSKAIRTSDKYITDGFIVFKKDYFNFGNNESDFHYIDPSKTEYIVNKNFDKQLEEILNDQNKTEKLENPLLSKNRGQTYIIFKNGEKYVPFDKKYIDMVKDFDFYMSKDDTFSAAIIKNKSGETVGAVMPMVIKDIDKTLSIAKPLKYKKNDKIYSSGKITNESEVEDGHSIEKVDGNRSTVSETEKTTNSNTKRVPQKESTDDGNSNELGQGNDIPNDGQRGISPKDKEVIEKNYKNQHELNKAIEDYINNEEYRKYAGSVKMPQEVKNWLKKYAGAGGLEKQGAEGKGLLSEYYTPKNIVDKMWDLTSQYVNTDGAKVLEPSVGIGRFIENAPQNTSFDAVEMNPVSAKITKILYPDTNVTTGEFQERFIDKSNNKPVKAVNPEYDIVIGNPPYGQYAGRYKGMGEGKKYSRLEAYFINRGLDSLKENGVMTFIVPSSFLDGANTPGKQEIGSKCEILDAYRLPENTFDTTSIGTDIIVLRKTATKTPEKNLNLGKWFNEHPEKVLGNVEERKNRFGKIEKFVNGDKEAINKIDTSNKDIKETITQNTKTVKTSTTKKSDRIVDVNKKISKSVAKGKIEYTEYNHKNVATDREMELWEHTSVDGSLEGGGYTTENGKKVPYFRPGKDINQYEGKLYNDFNYLQGNIYEKIDKLEKENITDEQKQIQKKKLLSVLPKAKTVDEILFNPTSDFIREYSLGSLEEEVYDYSIRDYKKVKTPDTLDRRYKNYIKHLTNSERDGVSTWDIEKFINGDKIRVDYHYSSYSLTDAEKKAERNRQQAEYMTKLKNTVDKTFNDFVRNELTQEEKKALSEAWNRQFNNTYNPDYKTMPMIVKGLNSEFKGRKLELQNVQVEGVNFLTNKGVGLLGFEVGVGKTLTGIISTVQNMQMGRCRKPLILVPKQVKDNWIREINSAFPNIEVNDLGNMSKFNGEIKDNTITVATYEALGNIWYGKDSANDLINQIYEVSNDFNRDTTKRGKEKTKERAEQIVGQAEGGNKKLFNIQDIGFDHITVDEAHNFKNLFADAKADGQEGNPYVNISGGSTSTRAARLFLLTQYILNNNGNRNVFMLTATPFNNSPLEVFNMLSYLAKDELDKKGLYNVYQFMENYADISSDWIVNSRNEVEYKQIVTGFKNASSLRELIKSVMLIRSAEDAGIVRPEKFTRRVTLEPSQKQLELIEKAEEEAVSGKKDEGAVLKAINQSRKATLSPDIATDNFDVSPEDFIKNSPKLDYVMKAVASMKKKDPKTSQLIYMPLGVKYLPKIKQYLINKGIYNADEIEIIDSSVNDEKITKITDSFNNRENGKVKLIIGTNKIKEGMNLNENSSVLYVPYMDWNPTDFVQIVGRIWRRGNRYSKIRVVVPLLKNSSDSFMFQKLNEKTDRINNIMDENKEYIDTSELNTAEEKINMISNPDKKMKMFIQVEKQKLNSKIKDLQGRLETSQTYLNKLKSDERSLKYSEENYVNTESELQKIDPETDKWNYEYYEKRLKEYKKDVATYKLSLKKIKEKIARLELDFEGKDSEEVITSEIEKVNKEIADVEEYGKKKLVEFTEEYEKERLNGKSIDDLIKEFENDTVQLYGDSKVEESKPLTTSDNLKRYEKTREAAYSAPVIKLETQSQRARKSRTKERIEKAKQIVDAKKYNKILKDGIQKWGAEIGIRRYEVNRNLNNFVNITRYISKELKVNDKNLREIMPFLRERTEFPEKLDRPELKEVWEKVHSVKGMSERLTKLADTLSEKCDRYWQEYKSIQANGEYVGDENDIKNYINHEWDLSDKQTKNNFLTNYFATTSKHGKQRTIKTYYEGINGIELENGEVKQFKPKTLDYAELVKMQTDNLIKATCDKALADSVKNFKTTDGANLVLPASQAPSNWIEINHSALNKTVARPVKTTFGERVAPDLQNILAKIGVAIGNRIPSRKGNGQANSLGRFVKNEPPEIRLQRWFSNKTLAHEVGHAIDNALKLQEDGFINRHRQELTELNRERIEAFAKQGDKNYAEKDSELIAELFGVLFNDVETAYKIAPSATNEVIEKMTKNNMEDLLPANFDWAEAKHIMEEKIVEFFKIPVRVHPDIAATLKTVFEPKKEYFDILGFKPGKILDDTNAVAKMVNFSLSGFHAWALTESYVGNAGITKGLKEAFSFKKIFNSVKNNDYDIYKNDKFVKQAISDGLEIGAPIDINRGLYEKVVENTGNWLEKSIPFFGKAFSTTAKGINKVTELNNKVLWDVLHNNYKINSYRLLIEQEAERGDLTPAKRKEIAQWVNDSFGGLVWENLGIGASSKKQMSRWIMSPDWLIATTRQFMGIMSTETGHRALNKLSSSSDFWKKIKEVTQLLGIHSITDDVSASGMRGRIARRFWLTSAIFSVLYMNILNAIFRMYDKEKYPELYSEKLNPKDYSMLGNSTGSKLYIFIGRNKDGSERYLRLGKQFREVPEMVADPIKHFGNKVAPIPQAIITAGTGRSMGGFENKEISDSKGWERVGFAAKNLGKTYLPYSVQGAYNKIVKGQGSDFTAFDLVGNTSKGMTKYKAREQFLKAYQNGNKEAKINEIEKSMRRNNINEKDIKSIRKSTMTTYTKPFKEAYKKALEEGDTKKIEKITKNMTKKNISPIDQRNVYTKALKEFYKERGIG